MRVDWRRRWEEATKDPVKEQWVCDVFRLLHLRCPPDSKAGRGNLLCFRKTYENLCYSPEFSREEQLRILMHDLKTAEEIGRKPDSNVRNNARIFMSAHKSRVETHRQRYAQPVESQGNHG